MKKEKILAAKKDLLEKAQEGTTFQESNGYILKSLENDGMIIEGEKDHFGITQKGIDFLETLD